MRKWWLRFFFYISLIAVWELLVQLSIWPKWIFPSFYSVLNSLWNGFSIGFSERGYLFNIRISLYRIAIGYGISLLIGIPLGLLLGRVRMIQYTLGSAILGLQALPSICWLPLALLWFGLNDKAIIFVVIMGAVLSISLSTADGVRNTPPLFLQAAKTMGAKGFRLYYRVILPAALPYIISGMKLGWSFAWRSLMAGELLYISGGLGYLLMMGRETSAMSQVIAVMLIIVLIGLLVDFIIFGPIEKRIRERWGLQSVQ
jgi:NitT/TauT family transport system permease protein